MVAVGKVISNVKTPIARCFSRTKVNTSIFSGSLSAKASEIETGSWLKALVEKLKHPYQGFKKMIGEHLNNMQQEFMRINSSQALKILDNNFDAKKQAVVQILEKYSDLLPKQYINQCKQVNNAKDFALLIRSYLSAVGRKTQGYLNKTYGKSLHKFTETTVPLEFNQDIFVRTTKAMQGFIEIQKVILDKSSDPKVQKIEHLLKSMYDIDYINLHNIDEAKEILRVVKLARQNNIPIPKNVVITPFTPIAQNGSNIIHQDMKNTVLVQPLKEIIDAYCMAKKNLPFWIRLFMPSKFTIALSTKNPLHLKMHEFVHSESKNNVLISYGIAPIPKEHFEVMQNISLYSRIARSKEEARTELRCKEIFEALTPEQKKTLEYLS